MGDDLDILSAIGLIADLVTLGVFGLLAALGLVRWLRRREPATAWFTAMFALLTAVLAGSIAGRGDEPALIALMSLFPFLLLRFTSCFASPPPWVDAASGAATLVVFVAALVVDLPQGDEPLAGAALAFVVGFLAHWLVLSGAAAGFFLREARTAPGIAARRMRLFAIATVVLALLLLVLGLSGGAEGMPMLDAGVLVAAAVSALLFLVAFAPPEFVRRAWLARELEGLHERMRALVVAESVDDVHAEALAIVAASTGVDGIVLLDPGLREPVAARGVPEAQASRVIAAAPTGGGGARGSQRVEAVDRFVLLPKRTLPWFGAIERSLVGTVSSFTTVAEDRANVLERERAANQQLRQVDQLKSEFVAMVAHDIRSPMSVIAGFADTIQLRWEDLDDARKLEYLGVISRNTRSLGDFVEDVLQVARMESGGLRISSEEFDARAIVDRIVAEARITHPGLVLDVVAPDSLPSVVGDPERNRQILANLVDNARKFGGDSPRVRIQLTYRGADEEVEIAVRDHGVGIAEEDLPLLFRRFSRVGRISRRVSGTGLGLYIVKSMVEAQGGRIWVDSTPGEGSTFTYTMPIAPGEAAA